MVGASNLGHPEANSGKKSVAVQLSFFIIHPMEFGGLLIKLQKKDKKGMKSMAQMRLDL